MKNYSELPSNSKAVEERPEIKPVVTGPVTKKSNSVRRMKNELVKGTFEDVKKHLVFDVFIPTVIDLIQDAGRTALETLFLGSSSGERQRNNRHYNGRASYNKHYNGRKKSTPPQDKFDDVQSYQDVWMDNRSDAEMVLQSVYDIYDRTGYVSIADINSLVGVSGEYTDHNYGWTDISGAKVAGSPTRGYYVDFRKNPQALDK